LTRRRRSENPPEPIGGEPDRGLTPHRTDPARAEVEAQYQNLGKELLRRARYKYRVSREDAGDLVQQAFVIFWVKFPTVKDARPWLVAVVDRLALNLVRTGKRRANLLARFQPPPRFGEDDPDESEEIGG
jgi:DNA-directed RNA polymerase specialized sigma24 family protein